MTFGKHLHEQREKKQLFQRDIARMLGVTQQSVSRWESDADLPPSRLLPHIAAVYDISLDEVFADEIARFRKEHLKYGTEILEKNRYLRQKEAPEFDSDWYEPPRI